MQRAAVRLPPNLVLPLLESPGLMLRLLKTRAELSRKAGDLYGAIVTQARQPEFYAKFGIPDTPSGRYEMVVLHLFLVLRRLQAEASSTGTLARALIETFVADMDDSLRELGTGDVAVGKKVRRAAAGFYERSKDYIDALAVTDAEELGRALARHVACASGPELHHGALAAYVRAAAGRLARQDCGRLLAGEVEFPSVLTLAEDRP